MFASAACPYGSIWPQPRPSSSPNRRRACATVYVPVALAFSSTIIIVKLLSDKREIDALHGRVAVGLLIVQDHAVILAMIGITAPGGGRPHGSCIEQSVRLRAGTLRRETDRVV